MEELVGEAFRKLRLPTVKPEQMEAVRGILERDVFVVLPTGFGKSACYQCLPLLYNELYPDDDPSIAIVVTPLTSIMKDQVSVQVY
jgi:ATP-dependent DNA helicase RecQ